MSHDSPGSRPLTGRTRTLVRAAWVALAVVTLVVLVLSIGLRFRQLQVVALDAKVQVGELLPADVTTLAALGLSPAFYAGLFTVLEGGAALAFVALGCLLFWRRSDDAMAVLFSVALLTFGVIGSPLPTALAASHPLWQGIVEALRAVGLASLIVAFLLFPDGHFAPRWTRWLAVVWIGYVVLGLVLPKFRFTTSLLWQDSREALLLGWFACWLFIIMAVQVYRYRRVSTLSQRQQTKWIVYGMAVGMGLTLVLIVPTLWWPILRQPGSQTSMAARLVTFTVVLLNQVLLAVTVAIAVLRHRLYDIDVIIRKTLLYAALTALLALVYFGSIALLQGVLTSVSGRSSTVVIVLSTLAIAALFAPLRRRIQDVIDRRFYRRKYDAGQVLARFAQTARDETDLDSLTAELARVVQETMQPSQLKVWLNASAQRLSPTNIPPNPSNQFQNPAK